MEQDQRFGDVTEKLLKEMPFSKPLKKKVDISKVNMAVLKPWIHEQIKELLGIEDEVVYEYVINMLTETNHPDPKVMQINLTGFLESKTQVFMEKLWSVLLEAQGSSSGVPPSFVKDKMDEMKRKREDQAKMRADIADADKRYGRASSRLHKGRTDRSGYRDSYTSSRVSERRGHRDDYGRDSSRRRRSDSEDRYSRRSHKSRYRSRSKSPRRDRRSEHRSPRYKN